MSSSPENQSGLANLAEDGSATPDPGPGPVKTGYLALLRERNFVLFWGGQSVSMIGNGIYQVGLAWTVYQLTGSTADMGIVLAANAVPQVVLVLFGGTLADRFSRRGVVLAADSAAAVVTWALCVAAGRHDLSLPLLITAAVALGVVSAFYRPAYSAMNRDLIPEQHFRAANALLSMSANVSYVAGPALGGVAYGLGGAGWAFGLDAASFTIAVVAMLATRVPRARAGDATQDEQDGNSLWRDLVLGLRYTVSTRWLMLILLVSMIANFACLAPFFVLLPALIRAHHYGVGTLGFVNSADVLTSIAAALLIGKLKIVRLSLGFLSLGSLIGAGTVVIGLLADREAALFAGAAILGIGMASEVLENTIIQLRVPENLLSRVYSVNIVVSFALLPLGLAAAGFLARWAGSSAVLAGGGALLLLFCAGAVMLPSVRGVARPQGRHRSYR
jgi:MFS family permease